MGIGATPDCPYKHRFWAPEIHRIAGKFYLILFSARFSHGLSKVG
jgi:GH43 family beta-xylosidase